MYNFPVKPIYIIMVLLTCTPYALNALSLQLPSLHFKIGHKSSVFQNPLDQQVKFSGRYSQAGLHINPFVKRSFSIGLNYNYGEFLGHDELLFESSTSTMQSISMEASYSLKLPRYFALSLSLAYSPYGTFETAYQRPFEFAHRYHQTGYQMNFGLKKQLIPIMSLIAEFGLGKELLVSLRSKRENNVKSQYILVGFESSYQ